MRRDERPRVTEARLIDETHIDNFRRQHLSPEAVLKNIEEHVRVLYRLAVGVGKSDAADRLLEHKQLYKRFDFVIYAAPTWSILRERRIFRGVAQSPVSFMVLRPRPSERCGDYAEAWGHFESQNCTTYAKATLCRRCMEEDTSAFPCDWPGQFQRLKEHRLLFCTEQQFVRNRALVPMVRSLARVTRILIVFDEARMLDANHEVVIDFDELRIFRETIDLAPDAPCASAWLQSIDTLRSSQNPSTIQIRFPPILHRAAFQIQKAGIERFGDAFRYIGYDLSMLATSQRAERWIDGNRVRFIARPLLNCHVLLLSAHLTADYAGERLGTGPVASPFDQTLFHHTKSKIVNVRSRIGADTYFRGNHRQILDTIAILILRNIREGRSTVLVSRKKTKPLCAKYLTERLAGWGVTLRVVTEDYTGLPQSPDVLIVPVIHYGVLGINDFADYDSAYCLNGYYISSRELSRAVQEATPTSERVEFVIDSKPDQIRRVRVAGSDPGGVIANVANIYLRKLEIDPVVQAVGRVRFMTRPREVIFFQMADLSPHVGPHQVVPSLAALRETLHLPSARQLDEDLERQRIRASLDTGASTSEVAVQLGISVSTLRRRLRPRSSVKSPSSTIGRGFDTPSREGGVA